MDALRSSCVDSEPLHAVADPSAPLPSCPLPSVWGQRTVGTERLWLPRLSLRESVSADESLPSASSASPPMLVVEPAGVYALRATALAETSMPIHALRLPE